MPKDIIPEKIGKETVYVDVEDDITSIINKVEATKEKVVALVLPKRASALQSIVNMKLLKRSAKSAQKEVVLVTNEPSLFPLAGVTGLHVAKDLDSKPIIPTSPVIVDNSKTMPSDSEEILDSEPDVKDVKLDYHRSLGALAGAESEPEEETQSEPAKNIEEDEAIAIDGAADNEPKAKSSRADLVKSKLDKRLKVPNFERFRILFMLLAVGLVGLIVFIFLALKVLPKATILISTQSTKISADFSMTTDANAKPADLANNIIVPILKTSDQSATQQVQATGQQNNGLKAKGSVTLSSQICGSIKPAADLPAGSGVTSNGLVYITSSNTRFSSSGQVNGNCLTYQSTTATEIIAQSGGTKYNGATSFAAAGRSDVTGTASTATSGGTDAITTVLSQNDIDGAKSSLTSAETDKFGKDFQSQLSAGGFYVIAQTYKLGDVQVSSSPAVGTATSTATLSFKISHSILVLKTDDFKKIITAELQKQIDSSKQKVSDNNVLGNVQTTVQSQGSPTSTTISVVAQATAVPVIDQSAVKKMVAGQKSGNIKDMISGWPGVKNVDVKLSPFWVSKSPTQTSKINVVLQEVAADNSPTSTNP